MSTWNQPKWLRLRSETTVYVRVGIYPSNTSFGSSRMYGTLYREVALPPGTPVADLPGGHFAYWQGEWCEVSLTLSNKHPFEKVYLPPRRPEWDGEPADDVPAFEGRRETPTVASEWVYAHGSAYGRGIDYIVTEEVPS